MTIFKKISEVFWHRSFWLPQNVTWEDFARTETADGQRIPCIEDLFTAWKIVPFLLLLKYISERHIFVKLGIWAGIKEKHREKPVEVDILEKAYSSNKKGKWDDEKLAALSKRLDWSKEQIKAWLRARNNYGKPTTLEKFCESSWRTLFFFSIFAFGIYDQWSKEWLWDFKHCWTNYPQPVTEGLYWYYIISLANYSSWTISHFWDVQRKDPKVMMFHHFVTITLLTMQWLAGFHRVGILSCIFHDIGDFWLEMSKCLKYVGLKITCQIMFILFAIGWIFTRNIIFSLYLVPSVYSHSPHNISQSFPFSCLSGPCDISTFSFTTSHVLVIFGNLLGVLHVYWTCLIFKVLYTALFVGKLEDDTVSTSDDDDNDDTQN